MKPRNYQDLFYINRTVITHIDFIHQLEISVKRLGLRLLHPRHYHGYHDAGSQFDAWELSRMMVYEVIQRLMIDYQIYVTTHT